jgi:hypothetical protein
VLNTLYACHGDEHVHTILFVCLCIFCIVLLSRASVVECQIKIKRTEDQPIDS